MGAAYAEPVQANLFGPADPEKTTNDAIAKSFQERLRSKAGFKYVLKPIKVKNSIGATLYYLFFASNNETGSRIAEHILNSHRS
jgi:three-Cys-motif partner protein